MNARKRASTVRFEPLPPSTPAEWRERVERAHEVAPFRGGSAVLNFMWWAYWAPPEHTKHPASVETYRRYRAELSKWENRGVPPLTHDDIRSIVAQLCARGLAAPWWIVTEAQATYKRRGW